MSELLNARKITKAFAIATGTLTLAACSGTIHGASGIELLDCKNGPKTNELMLKDFSKDKSVELGKNIDTYDSGNGNGDAIKGPIRIVSLGGGAFEFLLEASSSDATNYSNPVEIPAGRSISLSDQDQRYTISGSPSENGSTALKIDASCQSLK